MEDKIYNKKALILGVQKCLTEWLKGHAYVYSDVRGLVNAWKTFHTKDETTMKMFYWLHQHTQFRAILDFELKAILHRKRLMEVSGGGIEQYDFPPMDVIVRFLQNWADSRIVSLQKNADDKKTVMESWTVFNLHNNHVLKAFAKVFASGNLAIISNFEKHILVDNPIRLEGWPIKLNDDVETNHEIPSIKSIVDKLYDIRNKPIDTEFVEISDENVKKLFSVFLKEMEKRNARLQKHFQVDDKIRLLVDKIASGSSMPMVPKFFGIKTCDRATQAGESKENVQNPKTEQNVNAHQDSANSEVAKPEKKEGEVAKVSEEKVPAARSPKAGKRRSNFDLPTEGSAKIPRVDEWVKAKKVFTAELDPSRVREAFDFAKYMEEPLKEKETKDVLPKETSSTPKPAKVRLTPQEMKAANKAAMIAKKNLEELKTLQKDKAEKEAIASAQTDLCLHYAGQTVDLRVRIFQLLLERFRGTSQNLTDDLAKKLARRFIEKRVEVLSQGSKNNTNTAKQNMVLCLYNIMLRMGMDSIEKEHIEQLCMLNSNFKDEQFAEMEHIFLSNKQLGEKMKEHLGETVNRGADDPEAARETYDTLFVRYTTSGEGTKREVNQTNAKLFLETRIKSLSESAEGSSNDSNTLEVYQAVNAMDFELIPLELLQQICMLHMFISSSTHPELEAILVENLKAII